ncbi:HVO_0234 family beta-propeller protein [Halorarius halobius]|uniref:HVO_0234 family beta-propeller protein n=1 Tax=Halorarius halobius TaxID=2962671 RepID=UPI0020CE773E|nr:hypothetical protein [Halorarius halobius]
MSAEKDITLDEKRVYGAKAGSTPAFVATGAGLARVEVSADLVGEFSLVHRGDVRDVVGSEGRLAVAGDDALVGTGDGFEPTEFGPATAVGFHDGLVAAGAGRVARHDGDAWVDLAAVEDVRTIAGGMLAAAGGVVRLDGTHVGLDDARDVTTDGEILAATADGLYYLANGWMDALDGGFRAVAADGDRAYAVSDEGTLYRRTDDEWVDTGAPGDVADVALSDDAVYAVTTGGTFLANAGEVSGRGPDAREAEPHGGWRDRMLGLPEARRVAVP